MALLDAGLPADRFHIDAFDISERLLAHAKRGVYGRNSFRGSDTAFRTRYFQETPETPQTPQGCAIDPAVRAKVTFRQANLLDDSTFGAAQIYDAIFCRNLLIYFDHEARLKAVTKLGRLLRPGGLLCVAPAETGLLLRNGFVPSDAPQSFAFRKGKAETPWSQALAKSHEHRPLPPRLPLHCDERPRQARPAAVPASKPEPANPLPLLEEATRLANDGRFGEISRLCRAHMDAHGASADAYYLLALVSDASARVEEAATLYRKALYLDPQHRDALAHFSLLADKLGQTVAAEALRRRALRPHAA
jgi:chemotaxis protein methyltransferase WspC